MTEEPGEPRTTKVLIYSMIIGFSAGCSKPPVQDLHRILTASPTVERTNPISTIPMDIQMNKLFVSATVHDQTRTFIFDTGSPTMLSQRFATELGLEIVGSNTGLDANGREVTMDVAMVDSLALGEVTFHRVPVLVFDFDQLYLGPCFFDGGVIGSELLPGNVWRIDPENQRLDITEAGTLPSPSPSAMAVPLHDFGYPHYPVVAYSVGDIQDKAIFDTGNAGQLILPSQVVQSDAVQDRIVPDSIQVGRGSDGVSAGGMGANRSQMGFSLSELFLDGRQLGPIPTTTRDPVPTLIGAGILDRYIVTLDYVAMQFVLQERSDPQMPRIHPGYRIDLVEGGAMVTQLFDDSPAALAGLQLGEPVTAINGRPLVGLDEVSTCDAAHWLTGPFDGSDEAKVTVLRDGVERTIEIPAFTH